MRDAHDRYANIEVGYLLERMETYDGLLILTTNNKKNIDAAFLRRFRFIVEFPRPKPSAANHDVDCLKRELLRYACRNHRGCGAACRTLRPCSGRLRTLAKSAGPEPPLHIRSVVTPRGCASNFGQASRSCAC